MNDDEAYDFYADPANREITGPGRKRKGQRLTSMTAVRFAPEVIEAVKERAFGEGVTVGSWIRRLVDREITPEPVFELQVEGEAEPVRVPERALKDVMTPLLAVTMRRGPLNLHIGVPEWRFGEVTAISSTPVGVRFERPQGVIEGSSRAGEPRTLGTSLSGTGRSFSCPHLSVGNVTHAACGICGPLLAVAA